MVGRCRTPEASIRCPTPGQGRFEVARRGFLAELNYQAQRAEKRRKQEAAAAARAQTALQREADRARRESERAAAAVARANTAQRAEAQRQAAHTYAQYRAAE